VWNGIPIVMEFSKELRLVDGDHEIDCKIAGFSERQLRSDLNYLHNGEMNGSPICVFY
jgi:hypothetical protein